MSKTYAIADIHGRLDLLHGAYAALWREPPGLIVHLGDYVDRGKRSKAVIEFLMNQETIPVGMKRVILKGNHEVLMIDALRRVKHPILWCQNGGKATLESYGHPKISGAARMDVRPFVPSFVPDEHVAFLDGLPLFHCDKHRVYVHACIDPEFSLPEQKEAMLLWGIFKDEDEGGYRGAHVVHGHHQQSKPLLLSGRTNLDVGGCYSGRLAIGVFDDETPGGPVDIIEVREDEVRE